MFIGIGIRNPENGSAYFDKFNFIGQHIDGYCISAVSDRKFLNPIQNGKMRYHFFVRSNLFKKKFKLCNTIINSFLLFLKALRVLSIDKSINIIISRTPFFTAITAIILGYICKKKTLVEINGDFNTAFRFERPSGPTKMEIFKESIGRNIIKYSLMHASAIKLLYPRQIEGYKCNFKSGTIIDSFHDYVPISKIVSQDLNDHKYILTLGYPWYLKGVDTLILAYKKLYNKFPDYKLKVHGWCPQDKEYFEKIADNHPCIELENPVEHSEAIRLISNCSVFVLASRTEAMGRVLLEAMACKKPIVASNVGGIPAVIKDEFNGLLFSPENVDELFSKLQFLLKDHDYSNKLGLNGYKYVVENLSELVFVTKYKNLLERML